MVDLTKGYIDPTDFFSTPCYVFPFKNKEIIRHETTDNYVGLLLITYNDSENLEKMLSSLETTVDYPSVLFVIDMGSTDLTLKIISDWVGQQTNSYITDIVVESWSFLESLTKTMNHGYKYLMSRQECEYIGWVHPDAIYEPKWLSELVATLYVHPEIGKICSFNTRDGRPNFDEPRPGHEQIYLCRRGVLLKVGLFDERFVGIGGGEDMDMNYRLIQEGWKVAISPTSYVNHFGMGTRSKRDTSEEQVHNRQYFIKKWGSWFDGEMFT
jgi:GT2 family glycosyltransferase